MQTILKELDEQKNWKEFIKKSCRKNKIGIEIASYFTPNKVKAIYDRFLKLYESKDQDDDTCWLQNQLKAFHWFSVVLSGLKERLIQNFREQQWKMMGEIFISKDQSIMEYEAIKLVNQRANKNRQWSEQETQTLTEIIRQNQNSNKWNEVARKLFQRSSHKFFRSGKQCRERWLNHLDPNKKRGEWEEEEDKLIINFILFKGRRWSNIAKELGNHRTEHMVKNRYKTLIIRQKKITPRISNENTLLRQLGKRILGEEALPLKKQTVVKEQNVHDQVELSHISEVQEYDDKQMSDKQDGKAPKKNQLQLSHELIHMNEQLNKQQQQQKNLKEIEEKNIFKDSILSQVMEDCSKGIGSASTPLSYQLQQIYSPFYINYQGLTPYLSTSPSLPFFMNSSFSAFDNNFNQNLFIRPGSNNSLERKEETFQ